MLRTGDLGRLDDAGRLIVVGRKSDTIVTGGENVAPAEVEAVLLAHPAVAEAGVFARRDPEWGEAVTAPSCCAGAASPDELAQFAAERLARFKVPKAIELVDALPRTASGQAAAAGAGMTRQSTGRSRLEGLGGAAPTRSAAPRCPWRAWMVDAHRARSPARRSSTSPPASATPASSPPS